MTLMMHSSGGIISRGSAHPALADFDGDGTPEVYVNNDIYKFDFTNPNSPKLNWTLNGTEDEGGVGVHTQPTAVDILTPTDCNGDPDCDGLELLAGAIIYSVDLDPLDGDGLQIKVQRNIRTMSGLQFEDGYSHTADVNLDGILDIVTVGYHNNNGSKSGLYIWDKNGLHLHFQYPQGGWWVSGISIANVYDDLAEGATQDFPEIIAASGSNMHAVNLNAAQNNPSQPFWWEADIDDLSGASSPSTYDLNGDGFAEIFYRGEAEFRMIYGGASPFPAGVDNNRNWYQQDCFSGTSDEYPVIADVDLDGEAEVLFTGKTEIGNANGYARGRLWVLESDTTPWMPARSLWNQYNYFGVHINDDLTAPKHQQAHHLEFPGLGSGKRPYNMAHSQLPPLDDNFEPYLPVPDAIVQMDSSLCSSDSLSLWLTICNQGSATLAGSLPISFYQNDPTASVATLLGSTTLNPSLPIDSCSSFSLKIPSAFGMPIFVSANDNGSLPTPFDPSVNFPNTGILECDYENNFTSFDLPQSSTLDLGPDISTCNSNTNTLDAGNGFVKYRWQDGSPDQIFTAYLPGKYWVNAWDVCGIKHTDTVIISFDQLTAIDLGDDLTICEGETVNLSLNGFSTVQWSPSNGLSCDDCPNTIANPMTTITYHVTGADGNCFSSDSVRITVLPKPAFSLDAVAGDCNEPATITAIPTAGTNLDFIWSNGSMDTSIQVGQSGTYSVTATHANGCTLVDSVFVPYTGGVEYSSDVTPILCFGEMGSVALNISQTAPPYSILWSNGATTDTLSNLPPGNIGVTITDANDCEAQEEFLFENPLEIALAPAVTHISCNNDPGSVALHASGGTGQLSYLWSNGGSTDSISIIAPGVYSATVTDSSGCEIVFDQNIAAEEQLEATILFTEIQCSGGMDGSAILTPLNGEPPYNYLWENGQTDSVRTGLGSEPHSVTITDALGCEKKIEFSLIEPDSIEVDISSTPIICFGEMNGSATAEVMGGSPDYSYSWSNGAITQSIENLSSGLYQLTITDEHGCQDSASILMEEPPLLEAAITADPSEICPNETSDLTASAMGSMPPFTYLWSNMVTDSFLVNVPPGMYEVFISDANGCEANSMFVLETSSPPISIQDTIEVATGAAIADGAIILEMVLGGTPPFSFHWSNGDTTQSITDLLPGVYSLTITDAEGCSEEFEFEVGFMVSIGQSDQQGFEASLFPNPTAKNGAAFLSIKTNTVQKIEYGLYDVTGRKLQSNKLLLTTGQMLHPLKAPHVAGVYFLQIIGENGQRAFVKWVVVEQ